MKRLDYNTDKYPFTGKRKVNIPAIVSNEEWQEGDFDGSEDYDQVTWVTRDKEYTIIEVEGFGDVFDVTFANDNGELQTLGSFLFKDIN